jgi:hypothetical protein
MTAEVLLQLAQEDLVTRVEDHGIGGYECGGMIGVDTRYGLVVLSERLAVALHPDEPVPERATGEIHGGPDGELSARVFLRLVVRTPTHAEYEVEQQ